MGLKITTLDGTEHEFPFGPDSQLSVSTPDGVNGTKYGSWGEVANVELVADTDESEATAAAAELAAEHGVDLADVDGTGANGKVTKTDVERHIAAAEQA